MKKTLCWIFLIFSSLSCEEIHASSNFLTTKIQNGFQLTEKIVMEDQVYLDHIKTVELYRYGWRLSAPVRNLRDTSSLILEFDDLASENTHYTYTLIHCSSDWKPSDLNNTEYLSGLPEGEIRNMRYSRSALQNYKHYRLAFPNSDIQVRLPGNYIIYVYKDFDQEQPVITRRFFMVDPQVQINADIHRTDNINFINTDQEVDFTVTYQRLQPENPSRDFKVTICQNLNWGTAITDLLPKYVQPGELIYNYEEENLFHGGSEFRHFDTKSLQFNSDRVREIYLERPLKHVILRPDLPRAHDRYEFQEDLNGKYLVKWDDAFDSDIEADYVVVHFMLSTPDSIPGTEVYLLGNLTHWKLADSNKCHYNSEHQAYEISLPLKQGYYNYSYATKYGSDEKPDYVGIEGDHYETENDYYIFVYYRDIRERFDRLVGMKIVNSVKLTDN
ncbi:MAG: DUF5103 domain-containing protein [Bacteroidales bacterium]|nr:DUF5103 domain-containing protein [Bacteroidales bacterium]